jgi:hypothetical protein
MDWKVGGGELEKLRSKKSNKTSNKQTNKKASNLLLA